MSKIKFKVCSTPDNGTQERRPCARLVTRGTKRNEEICRFISECCSVTSSDIKAVLDALSWYVGCELASGYSVELEGLGHFSPALRSRPAVDGKGRACTAVAVHGVNFRCSPGLKKMVKEAGVERIKTGGADGASAPEERKAEMLRYLQRNPYINLTEYAALNGCSRHCATADMKRWLAEGAVCYAGSGTHRVYVLAEQAVPVAPAATEKPVLPVG